MGSPPLADLPLHVVVRDYPETLAVLRKQGVSPVEHGGRPVSEVEEDAPGLLAALNEVLDWRRAAPPGAGAS